jgi:hypothetical protein
MGSALCLILWLISAATLRYGGHLLHLQPEEAPSCSVEVPAWHGDSLLLLLK